MEFFDSNLITDTHELNSTLSKVNIKKLIVSKTNREKASPNRVLDASEGESNSTEEDSFSFGESSTTESPPPLPSRNLIKQVSPIKFVSSFFRSPFDSTRGKGNDYTPNNQNQQPLLRCFSYEEIASATNNFHSGQNQKSKRKDRRSTKIYIYIYLYVVN